MAIYVNSNITSLVSQRYVNKNTAGLTGTLERLSSGYKINHAADDAAGLSLSENILSQVNGTSQAMDNIQDGINMLQIAEGGLQVMSDNLQRIRQLAVQAANGTYATAERQSILNEIQERIKEISRTSKSATYCGIALLDSTASHIILQIGPNSDVNSTLDIKPAFGDQPINSTTLGITLDGETGETWTNDDARAYIDTIDRAISSVVASRSKIGAYQNRVESASDILAIMEENLTASESRIKDADIAQETSNMSKYQILQQASASVLTQANNLTSIALTLLQG